MPDFYPNRVPIRAPGYSTRVYASIYVGAVVASGEIILDAANDTTDLTVNATSGDMADARYGFEVVITTSTGAPKLRTHIRYGGNLTLSELPIRELSYGTAQIVTGDRFSVLREVRLHDKLVSATATFDPDYLTYSDQGDQPSPWANSGGAYAAFVDGYLTLATPHTYATVRFTGSTSFTVAPGSSGAGTHAWRFPAGSTPTSSSSADPSAQIPVGSWLVEHDFTDSTNGKTTTQYVPVIVHDLTHQPYDIMIDSGLQADAQYGWHYTMRAFQDATLDDIPDGSLVILWTRERVNSAWQSFRNAAPGRETILAVGYTHRDDNKAEAAIQRTYFDVVSPMQRLDEVCGYSKVMEESATPDKWSKLLSLTTSRAKIQLLYYYSSLAEAGFDLIFDDDYLDKVYPALYLQRSTPLQQVRELAHGVDAVFQCDRTGRFNVYTALPCVPLDERDAITTTFILAVDDVIDFEFSRDHYPQVELMKTAGFTAGSSPAPIFSLYPGSAPGEAIGAPTNERLICDSQDDLNERTGRYGAQADNVFIDVDGVWQRAFELKLTLFGSYDFFDFYSEYVAFSIDGSSNLRGVDLSTFRFWLKSVGVEYNGGQARTKLVLQAETNAPAGTTYTPPADAVPPIYTPPPLVIVNPGNPLSGTTNRLALVSRDGNVYFTTNFLDTIPLYAPTALAILGTPNDYEFDAQCPAGKGTGSEVRFSLSTDFTGYFVTHAETGATLTLTRWKNADGSPWVVGTGGLGFVTLAAERGTPGRLLRIANGGGGNPHYSAYSTDYLHYSADTAWGSGDDNTHAPAAFVSMRSTLEIRGDCNYLFPSTATTPSFGAAYSGLVPSAPATATNGGDAGTFHVPVAQADDDLCFYGGVRETGGDLWNLLWRGHINTQAQVAITPSIAGEKYGPVYTDNIQTSPTSSNNILVIGFYGTGLVNFAGTQKYAIFRSTDGGDTWTVIYGPFTYDGVSDYIHLQYVSDNVAFFFGLNGKIAVCTDVLGAAAIVDKTGNLAGLGAGEVIGIYGTG